MSKDSQNKSKKNNQKDRIKDSKLATNLREEYGATNNSSELIEQIPNQIVNMRLDDVLEEVKVIDATCDFSKCKKKTNLIGEDCQLCKQRFCFKHNLPEVHGCGEAVKQDERKKFLSPVPIKQIRHEADLKKAKKRLDQKLKDMQVTRMQKVGTSTKKEVNKK